MDVKQLRKIAHVVRKQLKPLIINHPYAFDANYGGACAISSYILTKVYSKFGITANLAIGQYRNDSHAFVIVGEKIIDITATQFSSRLPKTLVCSITDKCYNIEFKGKDALYDLKHEWPNDQRPSTYQYLINKIIRNSIKELNVTGVQKNIRRSPRF